MPSYPCKHPTCNAILPARGYCAQHEQAGKADAARRHQTYDLYSRDREARAFYNSPAWIATSRAKKAANPICERCGEAWSAHVHHRETIADAPAKRLDMANLQALCVPCHNVTEAEVRAAGKGVPCTS